MNNTASPDSPIIPASQSLVEITLRAVILGIVLTILLAAANAYLGLKVGQTISASIPAAIIAMSILRFFPRANILENTMVQTMASVGESLIAGFTYTMPALIILHAWTTFYYWQTVCIALLGGGLGVLFTIPLRRALLMDKSLRYPEGVAISNVLKASLQQDNTSMKSLSWGGIVGALITLLQSGFQVLTDTFDCWIKTSKTVVGFELGLSPALIAAGYIVGVNIALSFAVGIGLGWLIGIPFLTSLHGMPANESAQAIAMATWKEHLRFVGVGTMLMGGLWTLCQLYRPISQSIFASLASLRASKQHSILRTERDIPFHYVCWGVALLFIPIFILLAFYIAPSEETLSLGFRNLLCGLTAIYVLIGGFLFCSISAYFAGLIGSSNTPVSGLLVSSLLLLCLLLLGLFKLHGGLNSQQTFGTVLAIGSSIIICVGVAIANDTMQDLKVGYVVGATPWKQQVMLILGVMVSAFVVPPILNLLYNAYGIGGVFPRPGMNAHQMLAAPQAALMATVTLGVYTQQLEWTMIILGAVLAVIFIMIDELLKKTYNTRLPVLAVGLSIYLPMSSTVPVMIGGLLSYLTDARLRHLYRQATDIISAQHHRGLLLACGLVAGASLMGVILAIPFALKQSSDALKIMPDSYAYLAGSLSLVVTVGLCAWIYRVVVGK